MRKLPEIVARQEHLEPLGAAILNGGGGTFDKHTQRLRESVIILWFRDRKVSLRFRVAFSGLVPSTSRV